MQAIKTKLDGVLVLEPKLFADPRGFFLETYQSARYAELGMRRPFLQDNLSRSNRGVVRGLHLQNPNPQGIQM
jgi:dTDP-4-dehydrorhamnose 3,5-epimerase